MEKTLLAFANRLLRNVIHLAKDVKITVTVSES